MASTIPPDTQSPENVDQDTTFTPPSQTDIDAASAAATPTTPEPVGPHGNAGEGPDTTEAPPDPSNPTSSPTAIDKGVLPPQASPIDVDKLGFWDKARAVAAARASATGGKPDLIGTLWDVAHKKASVQGLPGADTLGADIKTGIKNGVQGIADIVEGMAKGAAGITTPTAKQTRTAQAATMEAQKAAQAHESSENEKNRIAQLSAADKQHEFEAKQAAIQAQLQKDLVGAQTQAQRDIAAVQAHVQSITTQLTYGRLTAEAAAKLLSTLDAAGLAAYGPGVAAQAAGGAPDASAGGATAKAAAADALAKGWKLSSADPSGLTAIDKNGVLHSYQPDGTWK